MANQQPFQPILVVKSFEMISFVGTRNIRGRTHERIDLVARRGDVLEVHFPSPTTTRQIVRFTMNSKYVTIYWAENTGSLVLYVNDKNTPSGYPQVHIRENTIRHVNSLRKDDPSIVWNEFSDDENMHVDLARLLGTQSFGANRLIALYWGRHGPSYDQKSLRKAICHTKWQNVASLELRRRCQHMMTDARMNFDHYFKNLPSVGAGPSTAPQTAAGANAGATNATTANAPVGAITTAAVASASASATVPATGNASAGINAPVVGARVLGATNAPTGTNAVATTNVPAGANTVATSQVATGANTMVTANAPTTGATTVAAVQSSATNPAGPGTQSAAMQEAPPMEPKRPVTWFPLTPAHLIKIEAWGNRIPFPTTPKSPGSVRPPAVFRFEDSDPFGTTPSESKVASVAGASSVALQTASPAANKGAEAQGQARGRIVAPPQLPPLFPHLATRRSIIPKETRATTAEATTAEATTVETAAVENTTVEATESISEAQSADNHILTDDKFRHILFWQEGLARAEAEAAEALLRGAPSGMLIDFGCNPEVSAPEGDAWGGRLHAEAQDDAVSVVASQLAGLEFRPDGETAKENRSDARFALGFWADLERWNDETNDYPH
ncbi:hypothetical protein TWF506_010235 [Arthrobotrys conoides]|uniref:Uncharacterized protein n=1 Tax=Arthrobotrys conoides TaxID=74498 RepID=A0AAN8N6B7_9PEZI